MARAPEPTGTPHVPTMGTAPKTETFGGLTLTWHSDGRLDLPGGIRLPAGTKWSAKSKGEIRTPDGTTYYIRDGKISRREKVAGPGATVGGAAKSGLIDVHGSKYRNVTLYPPPKTAATAPTRAAAGPPSAAGYPVVPGQTRNQAGLLSGAIDAPGVQVKTILDLGMNFLGQPYKWGGASPDTGFDCSGLIQYIYGQNGVTLPRVAKDQAQAGTAVAAKDAQPGDLIAFDNERSRPGIDHIGIYLGNGKMLQSPHTGANVQVVNVNLAGATTIRRVLPPSAMSGLTASGTTASGQPKYVYGAKSTPGATPPKSVTPAKGGGDPAVPGSGTGGVAPAGQTGDVDAGQHVAPNATDAQVRDFVGKNYGYLVGFLHDPELGPLLLQAAREGWDKAVLQGRLSQTSYWKKTSDTARVWDAQTRTDSASQHQQVVSQMEALTAQAKRLGYTLDGKTLHDMAVTSLRLGWNPAQIDAGLRAQGTINPQIAATAATALKESASDWMVPLSDQAISKWTKDINDGTVTQEDFTTYLKEQAKSLFPGLANAIDRGVTVKQYVDPYRQYAAQLLEISPDSIDFVHDPKFSKALFNTDPKTGDRMQMSLSDWQKYLRTTPDYNKTAGAVDQAAQFATTLTQQFGKVAA